MAKSRVQAAGAARYFWGSCWAWRRWRAARRLICAWARCRWRPRTSRFRLEKAIVSVPLKARIASQMQPAPFGTDEDVFEGGAHVYRAQCAGCHGTPGRDVAFAKSMYPAAPQLWKKHAKGNVVGVSDDEPGETYWKVANGIRLTGMPAYKNVLTDTQMWQVTLLLKNADQQLPDPVMKILTAP